MEVKSIGEYTDAELMERRLYLGERMLETWSKLEKYRSENNFFLYEYRTITEEQEQRKEKKANKKLRDLIAKPVGCAQS